MNYHFIHDSTLGIYSNAIIRYVARGNYSEDMFIIALFIKIRIKILLVWIYINKCIHIYTNMYTQLSHK